MTRSGLLLPGTGLRCPFDQGGIRECAAEASAGAGSQNFPGAWLKEEDFPITIGKRTHQAIKHQVGFSLQNRITAFNLLRDDPVFGKQKEVTTSLFQAGDDGGAPLVGNRFQQCR